MKKIGVLFALFCILSLTTLASSMNFLTLTETQFKGFLTDNHIKYETQSKDSENMYLYQDNYVMIMTAFAANGKCVSWMAFTAIEAKGEKETQKIQAFKESLASFVNESQYPGLLTWIFDEKDMKESLAKPKFNDAMIPKLYKDIVFIKAYQKKDDKVSLGLMITTRTEFEKLQATTGLNM